MDNTCVGKRTGRIIIDRDGKKIGSNSSAQRHFGCYGNLDIGLQIAPCRISCLLLLLATGSRIMQLERKGPIGLKRRAYIRLPILMGGTTA